MRMRSDTNAGGLLVVVTCALILLSVPALAADPCQITTPRVALTNVAFSVDVKASAAPSEASEQSATTSPWSLQIGNIDHPLPASIDGVATANGVTASTSGTTTIQVRRHAGSDDLLCEARIRVLPGWLSLLPPLVAIAMALVLRSVLPALFLGIWAGAWLLEGAGLEGIFVGLLNSFEHYISAALIDPEHAAVILFVMMIGGMIGILAANGGMFAVVESIQRVARTRRAGQLVTTAIGFTVFFDDFANTLLVGKTMRPLTDRLRISRQKLAYIVDSTASPVACLALVSTWIGYEVGVIAANQPPGVTTSAYSVFLASLPYSFYPILTLVLVWTIAASGRDFGPMYDAETAALGGRFQENATDQPQAVDTELPQAPPGAPRRALNFVAPIVVLVASLVIGLAVTGEGDTVLQLIGSADPYRALMWASLLGTLTAGVLTVTQRILTLEQTFEAWNVGTRNTLLTIIILLMAWALSSTTRDLHAADFLISRFGSDLEPQLLPALTFVLAALISFATGSCYGTMGIVMPIVLPLTWGILDHHHMIVAGSLHPIYLVAVASVLAGSILGDHSSPISDTTILSAMSASCDHLEHVRTQMPYAIIVGGVSLLGGILPVSYGLPVWVGLAICAVIVISLPFLIGKPVAEPIRDPSGPV